MNGDRWERRIIVAGFLSTGGLGIAGAMAALCGVLLGYPIIARAGIGGLVLATCVGAATVIAAKIAGNRDDTCNREDC